MATRRDAVAVAETVRTTPLSAPARQTLAARLGEHFANCGIPGFEADQFVREATRGPRGNDTPTIDVPVVAFTAEALREDWTHTQLTADERAALAAVPDAVLTSALREAFDAPEAAQDRRALTLDVHDDATAIVFRKIRKHHAGR